MVALNRSAVSLVLLSLLVLPLASCANSGLGQALQDSLAADPKLRQTAPDGTLQTITGEQASPQPQAQLPADFPEAIPRYPTATLQAVTASPDNSQDVTTVWSATDDRDRVLTFYREQLQTNGWQLAATPLTSSPGTLTAQRDDLNLTVTVNPATSDSNPTTATNFTLQYPPQPAQVGQAPASPSSNPTPSPSPSPSPSPFPSSQVSPTPSPQELEVFLGVEGTSDGTSGQVAAGAIASLPQRLHGFG